MGAVVVVLRRRRRRSRNGGARSISRDKWLFIAVFGTMGAVCVAVLLIPVVFNHDTGCERQYTKLADANVPLGPLDRAGVYAGKAACNGITGERSMKSRQHPCRNGAVCGSEAVARCNVLIGVKKAMFFVAKRELGAARALCRMLVGKVLLVPLEARRMDGKTTTRRALVF
jgi:hypothetical protein